MKWYCAKKFKPAHTLTDVWVRTEGGGLYAAFNEELMDDEWVYRKNSNDEEIICDVTHFCIPGPIEVDPCP